MALRLCCLWPRLVHSKGTVALCQVQTKELEQDGWNGYQTAALEEETGREGNRQTGYFSN
jgi:hypothetical protein